MSTHFPARQFRVKGATPRTRKGISTLAAQRLASASSWRSNGAGDSLFPKGLNPFDVAGIKSLHPPGVGPANAPPMAMDDNVAAAVGWGQAALGATFSEGLTFLGYPYLSELSQRPEYRVISETIATEMTRKWIKIKSKSGNNANDKVSLVGDRLREWDAQTICSRLVEQDGLFGRAHLYIDTGDGNDPGELQTSIGNGRDAISKLKVGKGSIKRLATVEAIWCYPTNYNSDDPLRADWYNPQQWFAMGKAVHATRLVRLVGREVPDILKPLYSFGGLSLSQIVMPYVQNWLITRQSVNNILRAFTTFVLATNMSATMQADGAEMINRALLFNATRDNGGLMMIDKESEDFKNVAVPLGSLDALQAQAQEHQAAPARIPLVKLLGISPKGLNASSEGEIRTFYDTIHSEQEKKLRPIIHSLLGFAQLDLFGEIDDDIVFDFEPLWELDEKELSEVEKIKAETAQILTDSGAIHPEENRQRLADDPDSGYDNIDVADVPDLQEEEQEGLQPLSPGKSGGGGAGDMAQDREPETLYVRRPLLNGGAIRDWAKAQGFKTILEPDDMHVTIAYSKAPVDWDLVEPQGGKLRVAGGRRTVETLGDKGAIVLRFESDTLKDRWGVFCSNGATWGFPGYLPHVTISYDPGEVELPSVEPFMGRLDFGPEIFEPLDEDWTPRVARDATWTESEHPRQDDGKFGSGASTGTGKGAGTEGSSRHGGSGSYHPGLVEGDPAADPSGL